MDLLPLAALLERAYRLALEAQDPGTPTAAQAATAASPVSELIDVLDEARVALLVVRRTAQADSAEQAVVKKSPRLAPHCFKQ